MIRIGLIINLMAGRDIRRLVAHASLTSATDKLLAARRILSGVTAVPGVGVLMVDDWEGIGRGLGEEHPELVELVAHEKTPPGPGQRTTGWVRSLEHAGARAILVVGGDGTQRNAAEADPKVPLLAVAGGTNNVACWLGEETVAGYAAAWWAACRLPLAATATQAKLLHVHPQRESEHVALIDVALVRQRVTGALAVWEARDVVALVLAVADPVRPGLSNLGGMMDPVSSMDDFGLVLTVEPGDESALAVASVLAPGLMGFFQVKSSGRVQFGESVAWAPEQGGTLALDGERTIVLAPRERVQVTLRRDGPWFLDPERIFAVGLRRGS